MSSSKLNQIIKKLNSKATPTKIANTIRLMFAKTGRKEHRIHIAVKVFRRTDTGEVRKIYNLATLAKILEEGDW